MEKWMNFHYILYYASGISIGLITDATLNLISSLPSFIKYSTREECLCAIMTLQNISAFNYFSNQTCQLFSNEF